ncbi:MAG: hypothetical protein ISS71_05730 [Phycisphaerae bacterium]|nr:hypothetical protein [Phycisphaerae bacterium]
MSKSGRKKKHASAQQPDAKSHVKTSQQIKGTQGKEAGKTWIQRPWLWGCLLALVLVSFGTYKAWTLYGVYPIPNPDFPGFIGIGKTLLRFEIPTDFKRAPMVGIFQVLLSKLLDTDSPELSAGWLLNAILSVANIVLVWQIGRQFIGKAAAFLAIVAMLNPWVLRSQVNPIAETTMIFFIMSTFYFMFRRSRWVYVFASVAALVRYECAALIFIAFLMDMILRKPMRQRLKSLMYAAIASIPFLLWMLGTYLKWGKGTGGDKSHYLRHYGHGMVGWDFVRMLWDAAFGVLTVWPDYIKSIFDANTLTLLNQSLAVILLMTALIYAIWKRQWKMLALALFFVFYLLVHVMRKNSHHRYCVPVSWILQLVAWSGVYALWKISEGIPKIPSVAKWVIQGTVCVAALVWIVQLFPALSKIAPYYVKGQWLAYAGMTAVGLLFIVLWFQSRYKQFMLLLMLAVISCVMVVSQQFTAAKIVDNGSYYIEFKYLSDWYKANSKPGEKLASRWAGTLRLINAKRSTDFVHTTSLLKAQTMEEFIRKCYEKEVVYVSCSPRGSSGTKKGLEKILPVLNKRQSYGPLQYLGTIEVGGSWINLFKLHPPPQPND